MKKNCIHCQDSQALVIRDLKKAWVKNKKELDGFWGFLKTIIILFVPVLGAFLQLSLFDEIRTICRRAAALKQKNN